MAELNPLLSDESFLETIVKLGNKTKTSKDATVAAEYFSNLAKAIATNPATSRHPKDVLHIVTSPSIPRQSVVAPPSTTEKPANLHNFTPKFTPRLNERLPYSLKKTVGEYQKENFSVLKYLIEYGGFNHKPDLQSTVELDFKDLQGNVCTMKVDRELMRDSYGDETMIPHIHSHRYEALLDSLCSRQRVYSAANAQAKLREMLETLELAIAGRSTVHDWHLALPPNDARVADNPKHAAFLKTLLALKDRMEFWL